VERARGLICALATDADNLFVILSAKNLNPRLFVATRAAEEEAESKLRHAGADAVFTPYTSAGYRLAQAVLRPHVFQFFDLATKNVGLDVDIEQVRVTESSDFVYPVARTDTKSGASTGSSCWPSANPTDECYSTRLPKPSSPRATT